MGRVRFDVGELHLPFIFISLIRLCANNKNWRLGLIVAKFRHPSFCYAVKRLPAGQIKTQHEDISTNVGQGACEIKKCTSSSVPDVRLIVAESCSVDIRKTSFKRCWRVQCCRIKRLCEEAVAIVQRCVQLLSPKKQPCFPDFCITDKN